MLDQWARKHGVALTVIRPGKPTDNGHIQGFNGKFRDECLDQYWFVNMVEARERIAAWRKEYSESRPHTALGHMPPAEFVAWDGASPAPGGLKEAGILTP